MKKKLVRLIDVKSIITIILIAVLAVVVLRNRAVDNRIFNLYSNITTMVITYFFTKKSKENDSDSQG